MIREGDLFDARFRVERLLGRGGMGEVWAATDTRTGGRVALKVLLERAARKPDLVARFEREAKIAASIRSPHVCQLLDTGRSQEGELFLALELLAGESLADRLRRDGDMSLDDLVPLVDDVLEGLVAAHATGVVHRDLKPANIFVDDAAEAPRAVLLDFGVSKLLRRQRAHQEISLTTIDATLGSFAYMAPEQVRGAARADERADVYAVGAVTFRALVGRLPFEGQSASSLLTAKLSGPAPSLEQATGVRWPRALEAFVARALARRRDDRHASAAAALEEWRLVSAHLGRARSLTPPQREALDALDELDGAHALAPEDASHNPP